jgi:branched-chain amino acid transport system substrate-binding protein
LKRVAAFLVVGVSVVLAAAGCSEDDDESVRIGALLPLSGSLQSYGEASQSALELAREAINEDAAVNVEVVIMDTATDPDTALARLQELHEDGVRVAIGPYASSEVRAVNAFADENGIVLVSPLSTAGTLAIAGDNVYRFTPDDGKEGEAVAAVALDDGITTIVPVTREDDGNLGLQAALKRAFEAGGGTVVEGVSYGPGEDDFESVVESLVSALGAVDSEPGETAVYLTAFDEVVDLFSVAATLSSDVLIAPRWYGSDSVALSAGLVGNADAAGFAVNAGYPNPILGLRDEDESQWQPVLDELEAELERRPDTFALAAYDALVVAHQAIEEAGADAGGRDLGAALVDAAAAHVGLTGPAVLNEAGDRASASFDFWSVCPEGSGFTWTRTISYAVAADGSAEISRSDC